MVYNKQNNWKKKLYTRPPKPKKVRKLAALMIEEQNAGILELSYDFACHINRLFLFLTEDAEDKEFIISKQVNRSGTSVGANVRESKHA